MSLSFNRLLAIALVGALLFSWLSHPLTQMVAPHMADMELLDHQHSPVDSQHQHLAASADHVHDSEKLPDVIAHQFSDCHPHPAVGCYQLLKPPPGSIDKPPKSVS